MTPLFIEYPKCSTCQKARKWLEGQGIDFDSRHIVEARPAEDELCGWITQSGLPLKRFFNTSGLLYKELDLKNRLPALSEKEQIALLASNGMLVKRPLLICDRGIFPGFREEAWAALLK